MSYASQDAEAARRICDALRAAGVEVWFDQSELRGGDAWDQKIRRQIKECALFVPIISANTQARLEGYFRLEWLLAVERSRLIAHDKAFLVPLVIDGTTDANARVPDKFREVQWTRMIDPKTTEDFAARVKNLLGESDSAAVRPILAEADHPVRAKGGGEASRSSRRWLVVSSAAALVAAVAAAWFVIGRGPTTPNAAISPANSRENAQTRQLVEKAWQQMNAPGVARGELELADEHCRRATVLDPESADAWAAWAQVDTWYIYHQLDDTPARRESAATKIARATRIAPKAFEPRLAHACFLVRAERHGKSPFARQTEDGLSALLQERPDEARALFALGILLRNEGRLDDAIAVFDRMARTPAFLAAALSEKGWMLFYQMRFAESLVACDRSMASQAFGGNFTLKTNLAMAWLGDLDLAKATIEQMPPAEFLEDFAPVVAWKVYWWRREPERMLQVLKACPRDWLRSGSFNGPKEFLAGMAHAMAGDLEAARAAWQSALARVTERLATQSTHSGFLLIKGALLARLGQSDEAERAFRLAHSGSTKPEIPVGLRSLYSPVGDAERTIAALERAVAANEIVTAAMLRLTPDYDALRAHPRFQALLKRMEADPRYSPNAPLTHAAQPPLDFASTGLSAVGSAKVEGWAKVGAKSAPADKSIAVLPFANMSPDPENAFFADGVHEDVITNLAKIRDLKVISRTSTLAYRDGAQRNLRKIAEELGVVAILEGSVRRAGNKARVTAQLIDARTDQHLWAETYDRELSDIFAVQAALAQEIAGALKANLTAGERALIARRPTLNSAAYDLYIRARLKEENLTPRMSLARWEETAGLYQQAVAEDPGFTLAHARLTRVHGVMYRLAVLDPSPERRARAQRAADAVQRLSPGSPEAHLARGAIAYYCDNDPGRALVEYRAAESGMPNDALLLRHMASATRRLGRLQEARELSERAVSLNPRDLTLGYGLMLDLEQMRRYAELLELAQRFSRLFPEDGDVNDMLIRTRYAIDGDRRAYLRALTARPNPESDPHGIRSAYEQAFHAGDFPAAARALADPRLTVLSVSPAMVDPAALHRAMLAYLAGRAEAAGEFVEPTLAYFQRRQLPERYAAFVSLGTARVLAYAGRVKEASEALTAVFAQMAAIDALERPILALEVGRVCVVLGQREKAFAVLRELMTGPCRWSPNEIRHDPFWSRLKDDPRFEEILKSAQPL